MAERPRLKKRTAETGGNGRRRNGTFGPGNQAAKANPTRGRSARLRKRLMTALECELDEVIAGVMYKAKRGDVRAATLLLNHGIGRPRPVDREADEVVGQRLAELVRQAQQVKPRPALVEPDEQCVSDVQVLAELGLPADGVADLLGVEHEVMAAWLSAGDEVARAFAAGGARHRIRLGVQSERQSLGVLERRDPANYRRADGDDDDYTGGHDERFV